MAKLRIEDLNNLEFEISKTDPPIFYGAELATVLASARGKRIFIEYDRTIDGPQTASRLIKETLTSFGALFSSTLSGSDIAIWIGGSGRGIFAFVVFDAGNNSNYHCYACSAHELTGAIMSTLGNFFSEASHRGSAPTEQKCETCDSIMEVLEFPGGVQVAFSSEERAGGVGPAERCFECNRLYCRKCYPTRSPNTCVCGQGRDAIRHIRGTTYRGSIHLVKVRYVD